MSGGVPIKVLNDSEGHIVTCEMKTGELYRGRLVKVENNMNCQLGNVTATYPDGSTAFVKNIFIRGSKIVFIILPDMMENAPMFKRVLKSQFVPLGLGRGQPPSTKDLGPHGRGSKSSRGRGRGGPPQRGLGL